MLINKNSENKELKNNILALSSEAKKAKRLDNEVINATVGMLKDEDGVLFNFSCVEDVMNCLNIEEKFAYGNSSGSPSFTKAILSSLFGKYINEIKKECYLDCIPTPGGTGALNLAFTNYVDKKESLLLPNHMWENYLTYGIEMGFNSETYELFDDKGKFNIDSLKNKVSIIKETQKRVVILINDPCENPTGFCMEEEDYDNLIDISRNNPSTDFVYVMDVAYFDFYNVNPDKIRSRFAKFKDIPSNALVLFVYSGSKSFGLYGIRIGALVALSKDEKEIEVFNKASAFSCRCKWSSAPTIGMSIIEKLVLEDKNRISYEKEVKNVCEMLEKRSFAFLNSANEVGLKTLPYKKGFFICVPCKDPEKIVNLLHEDKVYLVPTKNCLRIALCSINKIEAERLPRIIKNRLD